MIADADRELIARCLDGPVREDDGRALARRVAEDRLVARALRLHLRIADACERSVLPERSASAFVDAWRVRCAAEEDAAVFTAGTMLRIAGQAEERRSAVAFAGIRVAALAAAAVLVFSLGWAGAAMFESGRSWILRETAVRISDPAYLQQGEMLRRLRQVQP